MLAKHEVIIIGSASVADEEARAHQWRGSCTKLLDLGNGSWQRCFVDHGRLGKASGFDIDADVSDSGLAHEQRN